MRVSWMWRFSTIILSYVSVLLTESTLWENVPRRDKKTGHEAYGQASQGAYGPT